MTVTVASEPLWVSKSGKSVEVRWGEVVRRQQGTDMHATARRIVPEFPFERALWAQWTEGFGLYVQCERAQNAGPAIMVRLRSAQTATAYCAGKQSVTVKTEDVSPTVRARMAVDAMLAQSEDRPDGVQVGLYPYNSGYIAVLYTLSSAPSGAKKVSKK